MSDLKLGQPFSRRAFLGSAVAGSLLLAGCGSSSSGGSATSTRAAGNSGGTSGPHKRGGTLRAGVSTQTLGTVMDPLVDAGSEAPAYACFSQLLGYDANMQFKPGLAEEFEPEGNDFKTWTIRLREGLEFHNGKTVTADDVIYTIQQMLNPKNPGEASVLMAGLEAKNVQKLDARTVRLNLTFPNSQIRHPFAEVGSIIPVGFDQNNPIGCGPFKQVSYTPAQRWSGTRFENYWEDGKPYLDSLELLGFQSQTPTLNALLSDQIDCMNQVLVTNLQQLKSHTNIGIVVSQTGTIQQYGMNCRKGQMFEDPRVRKAFRLMLNREQLVEEVLQNYGAIGNDVGVFPQWDPACDPALAKPTYDVEQAKSLLKAAGKQNMLVPFRTAELIPGMTETADIVIQQAQAAGVTLKLELVSDPSDYYNNAYFAAQFQGDWTQTLFMYTGASWYWLGSADFNSMGYNNPRVDSLFKEALGHEGPGYEDRMHEVSQILHEEGPWIIWSRQDVIDAYSKKFTGFEPNAYGNGLNNYGFQEISLV